MLVRTWNVYHGNTHPPGRRAFLREMVELVTADRPTVVCLQEVPAWALPHLERWSGMTALGAIAARPRLGSAGLGRWITELHHGLIRSAVTGQANAILVDGPAEDPRAVQISTAGERRVCQTARLRGMLLANVHVTGGAPAESQLERALALLRGEERVVLAGDFNLEPGAAAVYRRLRDDGFSDPLAGSIDQIVVRGLAASPPAAWPESLRRNGRFVLSDHAPVELTLL